MEATAPPPSSIDPRSGFCHKTKTFHSLRPSLPLPTLSRPLSFTSYAFSLLSSTSLPDHPAFIDATSGSSISYPDFCSQVRSLAASLRSPEVGLSQGDVVFVLSPTRLEVPVLYFSLLSIGAIVCPSNPSSNPEEISQQLNLASPSLAFATSATAHLLPCQVPAILLDSPRFRSFLEPSPIEVDVPDAEIYQSDTAFILFSSGTTGPPKAAATTHRNYIAYVAGYDAERRRQQGEETAGREVVVLAAPAFHTLGILATLRGVALGRTTVVMERPSMSGILRAAGRHRATSVIAAPPVVVAMSKSPGAVDLPALRSLFTGGAPVLATTAERFRGRFPWVTLKQAYGMTEVGGVARMITSDECQNYKSVGRLNENVIAKIVDPTTHKALSVGLTGELQLKGPTIMKGYLGEHEATTCAFDADGWLLTGDLCYFDQNGFLYIVGRLKELIKYKGYQVSPVELEQILISHPDIVDAAVVSYPQEEAGEVPMAFIVKQLGSTVTELGIMDFVAKKVAPYKKIHKVAFVKHIPKNPSGKILRRELACRAISTSVSRL